MIDTTKDRDRQVQMTWVPVRDEQGRTHMEARWTRRVPVARVQPAA